MLEKTILRLLKFINLKGLVICTLLREMTFALTILSFAILMTKLVLFMNNLPPLKT